MNLDTDKLIDQYETYVKILKKFFPDSGINDLLEVYGTRMVTAPRGLTEDEGGQHGALLEFLCNVALKSKDLSQGVCDQKSAVRVALVHELGKLGDIDQDLFVEQDSSWHREKLGQNFKYNENCNKMSVSHRTLYILQKFHVEITQEEWVAILISQGMQFPENGFYSKSKPSISSVLDFARSLQ